MIQNKTQVWRILAAVCAAVLAPYETNAVSNATWNGGGPASWTNASQWNTGAVPDNKLGVDFYNVFIDGAKGGTASVVQLINHEVEIDSLTIDTGDRVEVINTETVDPNVFSGILIDQDASNPASGVFLNNGQFTMQSAAVGPALSYLLFATDTSLSGSGVLEMNNSLNNAIGFAFSSATMTQQATHTIRGAGHLLFDFGGLVNHGTITANQPTALIIDPDARGVVNHGTMQATNGGFLLLDSGHFTNQGTIQASGNDDTFLRIANSTVINTGHTIGAYDDAFIDLFSGAHIQGGTLEADIDSGIHIGTGGAIGDAITLTDVTLPADTFVFYSIEDTVPGGAHRAVINGTLTNHGLWVLSSAGPLNKHEIVFEDSTTLSGTGVIGMSDSANNAIGFGPQSATLTQQADHTIRGAGELLSDSGGLINYGTITADQPTALTIDPDARGVVNHGTMQAADGGFLLLDSGHFTNQGTMRATGSEGAVLRIANSTVINTGQTIGAYGGAIIDLFAGAHIQGGTLEADIDSGIHINSGTGIITPTLTDVTLPADTLVFHSADDTPVTYHRAMIIGTLTNHGAWVLHSAGPNNRQAILLKNDVTLTGTGSIVLDGDALTARITNIEQRGEVTNDTDHTIRGGGQLLSGFGILINKGAIIADNPLNPLIIRPYKDENHPFLNLGTLMATDGGTLTLASGFIENTGNTIQALDGSKVLLSKPEIGHGPTLVGGTLSTSGTGVIAFRSDGFVTLQDVTIAPGTNVAFEPINDGSQDTIGFNNSTLTNHTTWNLPGEDHMTILGSIADLVGTGTIIMNDSQVDVFNTHGADHTLHGHGIVALGQTSGTATNEGTIVADAPGEELRIVQRSEAINSGVIKATSGGTLSFVGGGVWFNTSGLIQPEEGSTVRFSTTAGASGVIGGTLASVGSGRFVFDGVGLQDVTIAAGTNVEPGASISVKNSLVNHAVITGDFSFNTHFSDTTLAVLSGTGTFHLDNGTLGGQLIQEAGHTIRGSGRIEFNSNLGLNIINRGAIIADEDDDLEIFVNRVTGTIGFVNEGVLWAAGAGGIELEHGFFTNVAGGRIIIDTIITTDRSPSLTNESGAVISGGGTLDLTNVGFFINHGTVAPGNSTGVLTVQGDYTQSATGKLEIELAQNGTTAGTDFDQLSVTAGVSLDGALHIVQLNGFAPDYFDEFHVLAAATRSGEFEQINGAFINPDMTLAPVYDHNGSVGLTLVAALPGDANLDGTVNGLDLLSWQANLFSGDKWDQGDFNLDGLVNGQDLLIWQSHLFNAVPTPGVGPSPFTAVTPTVPEPGTLVLTALGVLWTTTKRRAACRHAPLKRRRDTHQPA